MSCEQRPFIARLAVDDPSALQSPLWREHLSMCEPCRRENAALGRSLAIYRHLEQGKEPHGSVDHAWNSFKDRLEGVPGPHKSLTRMMLPATAAAGILLVIMATTFIWTGQPGGDIHPPQAVNLKPDERLHLQRVLRRSLVDSTQTHSDSSPPQGRATPSFPVRFSQSGMVPSSTVLAPNTAIADGRAPVVLFRTLRKLRTGERPSRYQRQFPVSSRIPVSSLAPTFNR